tara:strand:- start:14 stop:454 length:441 start_codon:yes stop_codon:yes gene_type:complete
MKRLLLPLLAALALPNVVNAEELIELKPINPHSYLKSSLVKWEKDNKRYLSFSGTTALIDCFGKYFVEGFTCVNSPEKAFKKNKNIIIKKNGYKTVLFDYEIDCIDKTYNRSSDVQNWHKFLLDQTPILVSNKYCSLEEWSKLPYK